MFEKLKSLFVIEEESPGKKPSGPETLSPSGKSRTTQTPEEQEISAAVDKSTGEGGRVRNKFIEVLFGAMQKNDIDGFDYLEFKQSLQSLEKMSMDEATRYQSAMAMAQAMGAQRDALIESAGHYLKVLEQEELKFKEALKKQQSQKVGQKEKELRKLQEAVKAKQKQIEQLKQEIAQDGKKIEQIQTTLATEKKKIESTANDFMASLKVLNDKIREDVEKMKQYLK